MPNVNYSWALTYPDPLGHLDGLLWVTFIFLLHISDISHVKSFSKKLYGTAEFQLFGSFITVPVFTSVGCETDENLSKAVRAVSRNLNLRPSEHKARFYLLHSNELFKSEDIKQQFGTNFNKINL